jgi:hypothetical protein
MTEEALQLALEHPIKAFGALCVVTLQEEDMAFADHGRLRRCVARWRSLDVAMIEQGGRSGRSGERFLPCRRGYAYPA